MKQILIFFFFIAFLVSTSPKIMGQKKSDNKGNVYVDDQGIMRWEKTKEEVHGFGVNYTLPFAHAYRAATALGVDKEKAIADDVYHFARLGFDLYRVHVWDTEISDTLGNLLENDHLRLFDYLLSKLNERNINYIITPIAFWGNGWPEPDQDTPGFSQKYGKGACLSNPEAIKAQENYLYQFLNHVNPYTGIAYKDEPNMLAFEVSNEPHHGGEAEKVTEYIEKMLVAMRKTGCKKPIFYNISHGIFYEKDYFKAGIQGGTFQWYPTGLVSGKEVGGNMLPNVFKYNISFEDVIRANHGAKIVYEFDAADVGRSYIYPAMARSFRTAGIQVATHFAYDADFLAYANTNYNTHYMNLSYAPHKALSLMIAGEVFHRVPMYKSYGMYPDNNSFDGFKVSYEEDLAEYISDGKFLYTNSTSDKPPHPDKLVQIAGDGNSSVVQYEGNGAYFLDKIDKNTWRLEVMPDAVWVDNPFGRNSYKKTVSVVKWNEWEMTIDLPTLGDDFSMKPFNSENNFTPKVVGKSFTIKPGVYLITRKGTSSYLSPGDIWGNIKLGEFAAPKENVTKTYLIHHPIMETTSGTEIPVIVTVVSNKKIESVQLMTFAGFRPRTIDLQKTSAYTYTGIISGDLVNAGYLRYNLQVKAGDQYISYPAGKEGHPFDWDFVDRSSYEVRVVDKTNPIYIYNTKDDNEDLNRMWMRGLSITPGDEPNTAEYNVNVEDLNKVNYGEGEKMQDYSFRYYFGDKIRGRKSELPSMKKIILHGKALNEKPCIIQLALMMKDGTAFGGTIKVGKEKGDYELSISDLKPVKTVTLPRPFPSFLSYYLEHKPTTFDISQVESLQFSIGPGIPDDEKEKPNGVSIESVRLN